MLKILHSIPAATRLAAALVATVGLAEPAAANLITNGDFETGTLSGWTVGGQFYADQPGTTTPASAHTTPAHATGGTTYAVTDQAGSSVQTLRQSFTVTGGALTLSFDWFNNTYAVQSGSALTTDNQVNRVDILTAGASANDTGAGVVQNLMLNTTSATWTTSLFNLNLAAGTYQLRFGAAECCLFDNFGIDNVSLTEAAAAPEPVAVPEPAMLGLFGFGAAGLGLTRRRKAA